MASSKNLRRANNARLGYIHVALDSSSAQMQIPNLEITYGHHHIPSIMVLLGRTTHSAVIVLQVRVKSVLLYLKCVF